MENKKPDLSMEFCGQKFINPFLLSSSPVSNSAEMVEMAFDYGWAGVVYKTLNSDRINIDHASPRMNSRNYGSKRMMTCQNVEQISDRPLKDNLLDLLYLKKKYPDRKLIYSIMGFEVDEWTYLAKISEDNGADMLELNFSCPHMTIEGSGHDAGKSFASVATFTEAVKKAVDIPVIAKMTPNITDMVEVAMAAKEGGADSISAINTVSGISDIDLDTYIANPNIFGKAAISGTSGPGMRPIGLRFITEMAQSEALNLPLSGMGGIETWIDALHYILVGASTLQVTTGIMHYGYGIVRDMCEGLEDYLSMKGVDRLQDMVGKALPHIGRTDLFDLERQGVAEYDMDKCVGCGQCYTVCTESGGQALKWNAEKRRPELIEDKCLSCMLCSFTCPVSGLITYKAMPADWKRQETAVFGKDLEKDLKWEPYAKIGSKDGFTC